MHGTTRDVLGEVSYLLRACGLLAQQIEDVSKGVSGSERLNPLQEARIADACLAAQSAKDHVELAVQYVNQWHVGVREAIQN